MITQYLNRCFDVLSHCAIIYLLPACYLVSCRGTALTPSHHIFETQPKTSLEQHEYLGNECVFYFLVVNVDEGDVLAPNMLKYIEGRIGFTVDYSVDGVHMKRRRDKSLGIEIIDDQVNDYWGRSFNDNYRKNTILAQGMFD